MKYSELFSLINSDIIIPILKVIILFCCVIQLNAKEFSKVTTIPKSIPQLVLPDKVDYFLGLEESKPNIKILLKNDWITSVGSHEIARKNADLVELLLFTQKKNKNFLNNIKNSFEELKHQDPLFFPVRFNLGRVFLLLKDHQRALLEFRKVTQTVPQYWVGFFYLAKLYSWEGKFDIAEKNFREAYKRNPFELSSLTSLGGLYLKQKRYRKAKLMYRYCLKVRPRYNNAMVGLGKIAFHQEKYYDAVIWFSKVDLEKTFDKNMHFYYAESALFAHHYEKAIEQYNIILESPDSIIFQKVSHNWLLSRKEQAETLFVAEQ